MYVCMYAYMYVCICIYLIKPIGRTQLKYLRENNVTQR